MQAKIATQESVKPIEACRPELDRLEHEQDAAAILRPQVWIVSAPVGGVAPGVQRIGVVSATRTRRRDADCLSPPTDAAPDPVL